MYEIMNTYIREHAIKGRCVHASRDFKRGELIETNHVIVYSFLTDNNELQTWSMHWTNKNDCIALGHINLLNHSTNPNVIIKNDYRNKKKRMYAIINIKKDEELVVHYMCELWFKPLGKYGGGICK